MRRTVWAVPALALIGALAALLLPASGEGGSGLSGVFTGPRSADAALRRISIPFGFESVQLHRSGRVVDTTGRIHCDPGDRFRVDVTIVQDTSEGTAEGRGRTFGLCTGDPQDWRVRTVARTLAPFESGPAVGTWTFTTYRHAQVTDTETNADDPAILQLESSRVG